MDIESLTIFGLALTGLQTLLAASEHHLTAPLLRKLHVSEILEADETSNQSIKSSIVLISPVTRGRISSPFGWRVNPIDHVRRFHNAVDIALPQSSIVRAPMSGIVVQSLYSNTYGWNVTLLCDNIEFFFAHLQSQFVFERQRVLQFETIGFVGSTGQSTGPHLHFGIKVDKRDVDPVSFYHEKGAKLIG